MLVDTLLYPQGQEYIARDEVVGFVRAYVPFIGWPLLLAQSPGRWRDLISRFASAPRLAKVEEETPESFGIEL